MSLSVLPPAVLEWLKSQGASLLQAGRSEKHPAFEPGKVYDGRVAQSLPNGRHVVQVANQSLNMALPQEAKPGDSVRLLYLKSDPRPTFLLVPERPAQGAEQNVRVSDAAMKIAALARWAGADNASRMPAPPATAPQTSAAAQAGSSSQAAAPSTQGAAGKAAVPSASSAAAQAVAKALPAGVQAMQAESAAGAIRPSSVQALPNMPAPPLATARLAGPPLLEQPAGDGRAWLAPLRQAVKESGLFYESHLNRWVRGDHALAEIRREPQARLAQMEWAGQARVADLDGMPEEVARLAGRQLQMLEGQPFLWQGLAWPGQGMQWRVEEHPEGRGGEEAPPQWRTELRLTLPRLGGVSAEIALLPQGVQLRLKADTPETLLEMNAALPDLAGRLDAAGLSVLGLMVEAGHDNDIPAPAETGAADVNPDSRHGR